jgi:hypothetical protein
MNNIQQRYVDASIKTADNLSTIARSTMARELSRLSLPEVDAIVEQVSRVIPAGNVPGVILNGLARLSGRKLPLNTIKRDINLLFKGVEQALDRAVYGAFFAGPAAVIWGYQNLLKLAGKDPEDAFPEGTWQFYVDYALREDTARHANETYGFDTLLKRHQIRLTNVDRITAWVMTAIYTLHQYDDLLANEWRERAYIYLLREINAGRPEAAHYARLYRDWEKQRPYKRQADTDPEDTYPLYRQKKFRHFLETAMHDLPPALQHEWRAKVEAVEARDLPAYQQQMSILAYLDPGPYGETRVPFSLAQSHVGLIYQGGYYLIPVCTPNTEQPADVASVRQQIATLLHASANASPLQLTPLVEIKRAELSKLRPQLNRTLIKLFETLRLTPILLNCDPHPRQLTLCALRQAERGLGDHALTLFDTGETMVFDQSHIFFDGGWGAALAEIMTNEALSWAVYLNTLPPVEPDQSRPSTLSAQFQETDQALIRQAPRITPEASAETEAVNLKAILTLRRLFKQRNDLLRLTVNDLLILYRAIHAATYQPDPGLIRELQKLIISESTKQAAQAALKALAEAKQVNPTILIPVDASQRSPRDRLYPISLEVPLEDLDLLNQHQQVMAALNTYKSDNEDRTVLYAKFDRCQREYLATLAGFGVVMSKAKNIALMGESDAVVTLRLLGHLPLPLQRLLDKVPSSFEVLSDIIKGREVFSNLGAVAPTSTLTRFITAKDDNDKKTLAWGVITDASGVMRLSLRDFRPHVSLLAACGHQDLAVRLTQDYLEAYARGLNTFVADLQRITRASRETQQQKPE